MGSWTSKPTEWVSSVGPVEDALSTSSRRTAWMPTMKAWVSTITRCSTQPDLLGVCGRPPPEPSGCPRYACTLKMLRGVQQTNARRQRFHWLRKTAHGFLRTRRNRTESHPRRPRRTLSHLSNTCLHTPLLPMTQSGAENALDTGRPRRFWTCLPLPSVGSWSPHSQSR